MKTERLLVLAKTYPTVSRKYEHLVCIAGLTEDNEWRRIYPVPWQLFWTGSEQKFKKKTDSEVSLCVIKPIIKDFSWEESDYGAKLVKKSQQLTLTDGQSAVKIKPIDKKFKYVFHCCRDCNKEHRIMCEDWELGMLYLKTLEKYGSKAPIKVKEKFYKELSKKEYLYFVLGTHNIYNTWLVVSVVYPKKSDIEKLNQSTFLQF